MREDALPVVGRSICPVRMPNLGVPLLAPLASWPSLRAVAGGSTPMLALVHIARLLRRRLVGLGYHHDPMAAMVPAGRPRASAQAATSAGVPSM
jgi:hypothetical protein